MKSLLLFFILTLIHAVSAATPVYKVTCEKPEECPEAITGVASDGKSVCTGVLLQDDLVATNLHCLPEDLRQEDVSCKGRLSFYFPQSRSLPAENFECDRVRWVSPPLKDTALTPDYAFLKLEKKTGRVPLPINTRGFSDSEKITIYKIDPREDGTGLLKKISCTAIQNSLANPFFVSVKSPVISLVPCPIIRGNSGSPMLSEEMEVKGLVNSVGTAADVSLKKAPFYQVGFGSNFACLNIPLLATAPAPLAECGKSVVQDSIRRASADLISKITDPLMKSYNKDVNVELAKIHEQTRSIVLWDVDQKQHPFDGMQSTVSEVSFKPTCINIKKAALLGKQGSLQPKQINYDLSYLEWSLELHLDDSGRPRGELISKKVSSSLTFSPSSLASGAAKIAFTVSGNNVLLPFCEDVVKPK
ncbi:MAG: trypsin-like peptidase domain-containing protein [Bdellovibrio sp.]|nr:trypsin-like peptidase domain-containing protein [Bdellovibrio sp.]